MGPPLLSLLELLLVVITEKLLLHQPMMPLPRFLQILSMGFWLTKKPSQLFFSAMWFLALPSKPEMFHMEQLLLRQLGERRSRSQEIDTSASSHLPVKLV